jgi:hypothetical protein
MIDKCVIKSFLIESKCGIFQYLDKNSSTIIEEITCQQQKKSQ